MTILISSFVVGVIAVLFSLGIWLFEVPTADTVEWAVIVVATAIVTLQFQDFFDKLFRKEKRGLVNIQYLGGMTITLIGVCALLWTFGSNTGGEFLWRLGATFLIGGADVLWMGTLYRKSITPAAELLEGKLDRLRAKEQRKWERVRDRIAKGKEEDAFAYLARNLRFALAGDCYSGDLDFTRPLAVVGEETLTYDELVKKNVSDALALQVKNYINTLV